MDELHGRGWRRMPKIFVSYRRDDSSAIAGWIHDKLSARYSGSVFRDIDDIAVAENFRNAIGRALRHCDVVIAIIGPRWLGLRNDGTRRIDEGRDWIRVELAMALHLGIPVIPVLVERGKMPTPGEVPEEIRDLTELNALVVEPGPDFQNQINRLAESIDRVPVNSPPSKLIPISATPHVGDGAARPDQVRPSKSRLAVLLELGRYKLAISITVACLALAVVPVLLQDEIGRLTSRDFARLVENPLLKSRKTIVALQQALCVPDSELGIEGPQTLALAKIYKDTDKNPGDWVPSESKLTNRDVQVLLSAGPCQRDKFENYFERKAVSTADPQLKRLLNRIPVGVLLTPTSSEAEIRSKIVQSRNVLNLNSLPPAMADQVTRDLIDKLARLPDKG